MVSISRNTSQACGKHYINDQRVSRDDRYQDVYNPATGEITGRVALASRQTVGEAVAAAQAAFASWADTPPIRRARDGTGEGGVENASQQPTDSGEKSVVSRERPASLRAHLVLLFSTARPLQPSTVGTRA